MRRLVLAPVLPLTLAMLISAVSCTGPASRIVTAGAEPARVCAPIDGRRLILVMSTYSPLESTGHELVVSMPDGRTRHLGIYPAQGFNLSDTDQHQRFLLDSMPEEAPLDRDGSVCVTVRLNGLNGWARVSLETRDLE